MISEYVLKPKLKICSTDVEVQKIDSSTLKMFEMVLASFQLEDKLRKVWFFQEIFLLTDLSIEIILEIFFLTFSNKNVFLQKKSLLEALTLLLRPYQLLNK